MPRTKKAILCIFCRREILPNEPSEAAGWHHGRIHRRCIPLNRKWYEEYLKRQQEQGLWPATPARRNER